MTSLSAIPHCTGGLPVAGTPGETPSVAAQGYGRPHPHPSLLELIAGQIEEPWSLLHIAGWTAQKPLCFAS
jgi:hypothetical protein